MQTPFQEKATSVRGDCGHMLLAKNRETLPQGNRSKTQYVGWFHRQGKAEIN